MVITERNMNTYPDDSLLIRRTIRLRDLESILPQTLVISCASVDETDWGVQEIEILDERGALLADDIQFDELPVASQMRIIGYLNEWDHSEREIRERARLVLLAQARSLLPGFAV
jgi:hypothetical protein